jgi:hypothetical protein
MQQWLPLLLLLAGLGMPSVSLELDGTMRYAAEAAAVAAAAAMLATGVATQQQHQCLATAVPVIHLRHATTAPATYDTAVAADTHFHSCSWLCCCAAAAAAE